MRKVIYLFPLFVFLINCDEPITPVHVTLNVAVVGHGTNTIFAGLPISMQTYQSNNIGIPILGAHWWNFGDGTQSKEPYPTHIFQFPGEYKLTVTVDYLESKKISKDTSIKVLPRLKTFGGRKTGENPISLFQLPDQKYVIVYSSSSYYNYSMMHLSGSFDSLFNKNLFSYYDLIAPRLTDQNNLLFIGSTVSEYNSAGQLIVQFSSYPYNDVFQTPTGYCLIGQPISNSKIKVSFRDKAGVELSSKELMVEKADYWIPHVEFDWPDVLTIHYVENYKGGIADVKSQIVRKTLSGDILFEKEYPFSQTVFSYPLSTGLLYYGVRAYLGTGQSDYVFTRVDNSGNVLWTFRDLLQDLYQNSNYKAKVSVFEVGDFIYIFYDDMKGVKLDQAGRIVWKYRFCWNEDVFMSAVINQKGNFVLLGAHQFDYDSNLRTTSYEKRDLMLLEVDLDGNVVY